MFSAEVAGVVGDALVAAIDAAYSIAVDDMIEVDRDVAAHAMVATDPYATAVYAVYAALAAARDAAQGIIRNAE